MTHAHVGTSAAQAGRTIIELLVAIALGLLILLGVGSLYFGASQSTRTLTNVATAEEAGNVLMSLIGSSVRRVGFSEIVGTTLGPISENVLYPGPSLRGCNRAVATTDFLGCSATANDNDSLVVWFQAEQAVSAGTRDEATDDCLGQRAPSVDVADPEFRARVPSDGDTTSAGRAAGQIRLVRNVFRVENGNLVCLGNGGATAQVLVPNVETFRVYFGFDDAGYAGSAATGASARRPAASTLRDAAFLNAAAAAGNGQSAWDFVVSVHVCAVVRTTDAGVTVQNSFEYTPCPNSAAEAADPAGVTRVTTTDGVLRKSYSQVFAVRLRAAPSPI